jgi:ribosomal protein S18 acetylase RimI-like enzyme
MAPITIRDATPDDAEVVAQVHVASWQSAYRHAVPVDVLDAMTAADRLPAWTWRLTMPRSRAFHLLVAEVDGEVVGFAGTQLHEDEADVGELLQLYLHPDAFGTGVAQALHDAALDRFRADGVGVAQLDVEVDNRRARRFYERNGWRPIEGSERDVEVWGVSIRCIDHRLTL